MRKVPIRVPVFKISPLFLLEGTEHHNTKLLSGKRSHEQNTLHLQYIYVIQLIKKQTKNLSCEICPITNGTGLKAIFLFYLLRKKCFLKDFMKKLLFNK